MPAHNDGDYIKNETEIYLDENIETEEYEMELCRFKLRIGANLRRNYVSFIDFSTEFDTVNIINTPFSAYGESSLSPYILRSFGLEMLKCNLNDNFDITFSCLCVQCKETIEKDIIVSYIINKLNIKDKEYTNEEIYNYLAQILESRKYGQDSSQGHGRGKYKKIVID